MPAEVQIVQFAVLENKLAVWVIENGRFELIEEAGQFDGPKEKGRRISPENPRKEDREGLRNIATDLHRLLVPSGLDKQKIICLIPDKMLLQIPFAALMSDGGKFLIEEFALSYSPSASVFVAASDKSRTHSRGDNEKLLAFGNPAFDRIENADLADLPDAESEVRQISKFYKNTEDYFKVEATKERFLRGLETANVIHFAGHYVANPRSPANSKLVFSDGALRSSELSWIKLKKTNLVVLSACETAIETVNKSEGAVGIARTFLALGAAVVVASSWRVDSEAAGKLLTAFHRKRRAGGVSDSEAIGQAQREMLSVRSAPYYWAAFSIIGGVEGINGR